MVIFLNIVFAILLVIVIYTLLELIMYLFIIGIIFGIACSAIRWLFKK